MLVLFMLGFHMTGHIGVSHQVSDHSQTDASGVVMRVKHVLYVFLGFVYIIVFVFLLPV